MKLTLAKVLNLQAGLNALDSYDKIVGDKVIKELYQLGGPVRLTIARNLNRLEPEVTAFQKTRNSIVQQCTNGTGTVNMAEFVEGEGELLATVVDVDLKPLSEADLALDRNPVPGTVLAALMPILEG